MPYSSASDSCFLALAMSSPSASQSRWRDAASRLKRPGVRTVSRAQPAGQLVQLLGRGKIGLVHDDHVGKLHLLQQQIHDAAVIVRSGALVAIRHAFVSLVIAADRKSTRLNSSHVAL